MIRIVSRLLKPLMAVALATVLISPSQGSAKSDFALATASEATFEGEDTGLNGDDDASGQLPIGFSFSFYGQTQTNSFLTTNGVLNFASQGANAEYSNGVLTGAGRNQSIFAFWDDLATNGSNKIRYSTIGEAPNRKFVAQWYSQLD